MPYTPVSTETFGGLDLYNDPTEIGLDGAVSLLNVDLDQRGRVRSRDGSSAVSSVAAPNVLELGMSYYKDAGGTEWIVTVDRTGGVLRPYNIATGAAGTTVAETLAVTQVSNNSFARFGDPSNTRLYTAANGNLRRFDGTTWSGALPSIPIAPNLVAVTANDNRLAIATGSSSRIQFSDAGAPETFGANNWIDLWPGDGESVKALVRWRDYLLAFKQSKFAVFTSTAVHSDGTPEFTYRSVDAGRGVFGVGMAVPGEQGVYFADAFGIYVTTGGPPQYISKPIEPWLRQSVFTGLPTFILRLATLTYADRRLYVTFPNGTSSVTLVYDTQTSQWFVWQGGFLVAVGVPASSQYTGLYFGDNTSKKLAKMDSSVTTDLGSAIPWSYTTGYSDVGGYFRGARIKSAQRKNLKYTDLFGSGTFTHQVLSLNARPNDVADPGGTITLGTAPTVARGSRRRAVRGTFFAHKLSGTTAASISKLTHWLPSVEQDT